MLSLYPFQTRNTLSLLDEFRRSFDHLLPQTHEGFFQRPQIGPRMTSQEQGDAYTITIEAPGFSNDDIKVSTENGILTIEGKRETETPEGYKALRQERSALEFQQQLTLPKGVASQETHASLVNGVLTITLPKDESAQTRTIPVTTEEV